MAHGLAVTLRTVTAAAWAFALYAALPWGRGVHVHAVLFALSVAIVGTVATVTRSCARPADEVYLAGKAVGRLEVLSELDDDKVVSLDQRRTRTPRRASL